MPVPEDDDNFFAQLGALGAAANLASDGEQPATIHNAAEDAADAITDKLKGK